VLVEVFPEPTVNAGADQQIDYGDQAQLQATGNGLIAWLTNPTLSCLTCTNPIASPEFSSTYIVTLTDTNGCVAKDDVFVIVDGTLYVPNTFTPNGDGINDAFYALATEVKTFKLYVFNRWGENIFSTDNVAEHWDGTLNGGAVPDGVYVVWFRMRDVLNIKHEHFGQVTLMR